MYRPYQISISEINELFTAVKLNDFKKYRNEYICFIKKIRSQLKLKFNCNNIIDSLARGSRLQELCFSSEFIKSEFDVFISHSHKDEVENGLITDLAAYLYGKYQIRSFVDSEYWLYCNDIIKNINEEIGNRKFNKLVNREVLTTYSADDLLYISSNIYAMLSMAILRMIDNIPCVIFVNSENSLSISINHKGKIGNVTLSPWIYEEINYINSIKEKRPNYYQSQINESRKCFSEGFAFDVKLGNFRQLNANDLINLPQVNPEKTMCAIFDLYNKLPYNINCNSFL